ncbi:MAG: PQQ-binding-like beta-propeller repeat protein [bacterium]|nr:PQQ-binding-like beta-propeller repeat protein [bacterium]
MPMKSAMNLCLRRSAVLTALLILSMLGCASTAPMTDSPGAPAASAMAEPTTTEAVAKGPSKSPGDTEWMKWANWRGPWRNGVSPETDLISSWSVDGENLLWRVPWVGRSTPIVLPGKVCANGRVGEEIRRQEIVACFDTATGEQLWEHRFNVFHTSVPWTRVGWAHITGDPETGYLYVQGVGGIFLCLNSATGEVVWSRRLIEELGFMEGYGGRTQTPFVDGDKIIVTFSNTSWGPEGKPLHRFRAFDKRTGELLWVSQPAPSQADKNTQSTPNLLVVDGRRLIVAGNGGGGIYAVEAETGEPVWGFQLSKRGINSSVLVDGTRVFVSHSEENVDEATMGRVVAIDGTGTGDVTQTHEIWRAAISAGFTTAALAEGVLYVVDNSANLHALNADTGEELWELSIGRVGKGSPVWADGKLYLTEVNGRVVIVEAGETEGTILDVEEIKMPDGRTAEIYGSVAIADGRIFFTTEEGLYAIGDPEAASASAAPVERVGAEMASEAMGHRAPAKLRVIPAEVYLRSDETADFRAMTFDPLGRPLGEQEATWSLTGLTGTVDSDGVYTPDPGAASDTGMIVARVGDLEAKGRIRVLRYLPLEEDFESTEPGSRPSYMMAYLARFSVTDLNGNRVLTKGPSPIKIHRHITFLGHPAETDYTIEADIMGTKNRRRMPDIGLINSGYTLDLLGDHQRVQVRSWQAGLRMMQQIDFAWEPDVWYRMKFEVRAQNGEALVRGKIWPRGEDEPSGWTLSATDPLPIPSGAPGLSGFSPTPLYYDNIRVMRNN